MWKLTGHPKTQQVTSELARKFANMDAAPDDRPVSENRLRVYEKLMREGKFRPMTWAAAVCKETGGTYRVNGKHTSILCAELPLKEIPHLYAVVEYYDCEDLGDVSRLYSTFDSKMQSRTVSDINRSFAACVPQLEHIPLHTVNMCISAIWYSSIQKEYGGVPPQERAEVLFDHHDFVAWVDNIIGRKNQFNYLKKYATVAAMYLTWSKAPRIATDFWQEVRDDTGPSPQSPSRVLSRFLLMTYGRGNSLRSRRNLMTARPVQPRELFVKSLHSWNAYRMGEQTRLAYHPNAEIPAVK